MSYFKLQNGEKLYYTGLVLSGVTLLGESVAAVLDNGGRTA
jgi:hypothetical protein